MQIVAPLIEATFLQRLNRFSALVERRGRKRVAYLPNSGRLKELLTPGRRVLLTEKTAPWRRTRYDISLVSVGETLVSVDARVPGGLVYEALIEGTLPRFRGYSEVRREASFGQSRLDFLLTGDNRRCLLEVKSVTLVRTNRALFPDAPTLRGRRHLQSLLEAKKMGYEGAIVFVVQRADAESFSPNDEIDPEFGRLLRQVESQGVDVHAYTCQVSTDEIKLAEEIPVCL